MEPPSQHCTSTMEGAKLYCNSLGNTFTLKGTSIHTYTECVKSTHTTGIRARQDKLPLQFLLQISKRQPFIHCPRTRSRHVVQVFRRAPFICGFFRRSCIRKYFIIFNLIRFFLCIFQWCFLIFSI